MFSGNSSGTGYCSIHKVVCQICQNFGHNVLDCYNGMNYLFQCRHPPSQLAAMVAETNSGWLSNSGCNAHLTFHLANLTVASPFNGEEGITVGNGQNLNVTHFGSGMITTPHKTFCLNNVLWVPSIKANLLFVHQFCLDNTCSFVLNANSFSIIDRTLGLILYIGPCQNCLYPLPHSMVARKGVVAHLCAKVSHLMWHNHLGHPSNQVLTLICKSIS